MILTVAVTMFSVPPTSLYQTFSLPQTTRLPQRLTKPHSKKLGIQICPYGHGFNRGPRKQHNLIAS